MENNFSLLDIMLENETYEESKDGVFSDEVTETSILVNILIISTALCLFGVSTNMANIIVFLKQGYKDTININLSAIAISDTGACITLLWTAVCYNPLFVASDPPFLQEVEYMTGGAPHQMTLNITAWLTAFVTFERCISIAYPLKVKTIITTWRVKCFILTTYVLTFLCKIPLYSTTRIMWKFVPEKNDTYLGLILVDNHEVVDVVNFYGTDLASLFMSFCIVVICTLILAIKLWQKSKWRQSSAANINVDKDKASAKDKRVIKMVVMVAVIFITCYTPRIFLLFWMAIFPQFRVFGKYGNNFQVAYSFCSVLESLNASMNIFVYYAMSTKYRQVFRATILRKKEEASQVS